MAKVSIPVKKVNGEDWAELNIFGNSHDFCGEKFKVKMENFSFSGGHRVRLYTIKNNVHWKIPAGVSLDIGAVAPATSPRREPRR